MIRHAIAASLAVCSLLTTVSTAQAHFLWLVPNEEEGRVDVFFSESADPDDPALFDRLKNVVVMHRDADGKLLKSTAIREDDWLGIQPTSSKGTFVLRHEYGVLDRGGDVFLLNYAAKTYSGTPARELGDEAAPALDVLPRARPGRLDFEVRWRGKPLAGAEVVVDTPEFDRIEGKTNAKGIFGVDVKSAGTFAARAKHVVPESGKRGEKAFGSARYYTTATIPLGTSTKGVPTATSRPDARRTLPDLPRGLTSFGAAVLNDRVYVYGGHTGSAHDYYREGQSDELLVLDLAAPKAWRKVGTVPRRQGLALVAHGEHLYRIGGFQARNEEGEDRDLQSTRDFARFDPRSGKWKSLPPLPEPRSSHDAVVIGDDLYVVGGWAMGDGEPKWHDTALVVDLSADSLEWRELPDPPFRRRALSAGEQDGKLYVVGGMQPEGGPTTRVAVFDPDSRKWSEGPALISEGRMGGFGSSAFRCGRHLFVSTYEGRLQRLDDASGKWVQVAQLEHPRFFHRLLSVDDARLLVIGGASMQSGKILETEAFSVDELVE